MSQPTRNSSPQTKASTNLYHPIIRGAIIICLLIIILVSLTISGHYYLLQNTVYTTPHNDEDISLTPFPISVNPKRKTITENPLVESYHTEQIASNHTPTTLAGSWFQRLTAKLALMNWYQNIASPIGRILVIQSGERQEEIIKNFSTILGWNETQKTTFLNRINNETPVLSDGKFYPGTYMVNKNASAEEVAIAISDRFNADVRTRYPSDIEAIVPLHDTLIIASLLEREAYDFEDMRYISGIIWNRLFIDMPLQLDATLQYVRGSNSTSRFWPVPVPADKYLDSPYNTYQNKGLPPSPIANPSIDAMIAALNPRLTDCLFYFHSSNGQFHCTDTYEEHVDLLKKFYGQGQ